MELPYLSIRDVDFAYRDKPVLKSVSLDVRAGGVTMLLGPNGSGKTTLFSLISRFFVTHTGAIEIAGQDLRRSGSAALCHVGIVFQQTTLDLDLTVGQNLRYFANLQGMSKSEVAPRILAELGRFDMTERVGENVRTLNGGHRRRVEIARALLHQPRLLLLDEPTVGLDIETRRELIEGIHERARSEDIAVLWATHLADEVQEQDALVILNRGEVAYSGSASDVIAETKTDNLENAFSAITAPVAR